MWHLWPEFHCNWCLYITSLPEASFMSYEYFKCAFSYTLLCTQHYLKCYISSYYMAYKIKSDIYDAQCKNNNSLLWVTFDLGVWPLTSLTYDGFYIASITQLSLQLLFVWGSNHTRQKVFTKLLTDTQTDRHTDTHTDEACSHKVFSANDLKNCFVFCVLEDVFGFSK